MNIYVTKSPLTLLQIVAPELVFDGHHLRTQELEYEMFINLHLSDVLMRAV